MNKKKNKLRSMYIDKKMTLKEIGDIYNISPQAVAKRMDKYNIKRRSRSESAYTYYNKTECFQINLRGQKDLVTTGLVLYWCEGTHSSGKGKKNGTLAFTNTDILMLRIWLKFLYKIYNLERNKIRIRLYIHQNQNGQVLKKYWSKQLGIPFGNFENISYTNKIATKPNYKGTVKIKVHNIKLYDLIEKEIENKAKRILFS